MTTKTTTTDPAPADDTDTVTAAPPVVGSVISTVFGRALVVDVTEDGLMICDLPRPRLYQLATD
jgi:hypothetical protein